MKKPPTLEVQASYSMGNQNSLLLFYKAPITFLFISNTIYF